MDNDYHDLHRVLVDCGKYLIIFNYFFFIFIEMKNVYALVRVFIYNYFGSQYTILHEFLL